MKFNIHKHVVGFEWLPRYKQSRAGRYVTEWTKDGKLVDMNPKPQDGASTKLIRKTAAQLNTIVRRAGNRITQTNKAIALLPSRIASPAIRTSLEAELMARLRALNAIIYLAKAEWNTRKKNDTTPAAGLSL